MANKFKNPITIVQGAPTPIANPLISWGGSSAPAPIQTANGDWFLPYYNNAHGLLMTDKNTKMVEYFSTATEWRVIVRAKITNLPTSGTWIAFCGTTNTSSGDNHNYPYMYISAENAFRGVGVNKNNTNEWFGVEDLTDKITLGEWAYFCGYQKDGFISYSLYDDNGMLLGVGAKPDMHLLANATYNFEIGGVQGRSTHYAKETYFDLNEIYVEKNGQAIFGTETTKMQNMGVFNFDDWNEFTEVEYIQSDGNQYIDTGVGGAIDNIAVDCKFYTETSNYNYMYGQDQNGQAMSYNGLYRNTILEIMYKEITFNGARLIEMSQTIVGNSMNIVINGVSYSTPVGKSETSKNMLIFACFNKNGVVRYYTGNTKCYYFVIKDGDTVLRNLKPCYHTQTGIIGMFDLIGNKFYTNAGTGEFIKGPDVVT